MQVRSLRSAARHLARCDAATLTSAAWHSSRRSASIVWKRGAKRKTTITFDDLPQGALPALTKAPSTEAPEPSYPRVMQGHLDNVRTYNDCVVLTRVGDFYEMYFHQADEYAAALGIRLAKRTTSLGPVSMAGFPHTQLDRYLKMLVQDMGKKVALSEQVPLPVHEQSRRSGAPLYDRQVKRIITPGTLIDESFLTASENNFLLAVHFDEQSHLNGDLLRSPEAMVGLGWVDLSSGEFNVQSAPLSALPSLVARISPKEIVLDQELQSYDTVVLQKLFGDQIHAFSFQEPSNTYINGAQWVNLLEDEVKLPGDLTAQELTAGGLILDYVTHRLLDANIKLQAPIRRSESEYMLIDKQSLRALEIKATLRDGLQQGSLLNTIRRTVTNSGARLLSRRIVSPSMSLAVIQQRLDLVERLLLHAALREDITTLLKDTSDTSRLLQKFSIGKGEAEDMLGIAKTIRVTEMIRGVLTKHQQGRDGQSEATEVNAMQSDCVEEILQRLDLESPIHLAKSILAAIDEANVQQKHLLEIEKAEQSEKLVEEVVSADDAGEATPKLARKMLKDTATKVAEEETDIWIMRKEASPALRTTHNVLQQLLERKQMLTADLRARHGAESLSLKWTPRYGHYVYAKGKDGTKLRGGAKAGRAAPVYDSQWTTLGQEIDNAKDRIRAEEDRVFTKLKAHVFENLMKLRRNAAVLDELDVACSSAVVAKERNLVRPILNDSRSHNIVGGRHPTVDVSLFNQGRRFTANDCLVGDNQLVHLITGPNMGGKSTYLRQNALITILAQTGCFVPAQYAELGLVDRIFSRVGSADSLHQDQSTFMVEMLETAEILRQATSRSFVIMDEIGRGTTPEDGVAVGYACLHHLHYVNQCRSLFATHFHALADMTGDFDKLQRYCTDVAEEDEGSWIYVHKLQPGVNRKSHALKVARMAGLPEQAIQTASEVLASLSHEQATSLVAAVA